MIILEIILNAIVIVIVQFIINGLKTAWGMLYMYIFYRDKNMRKHILETDYMNNYVVVSQIGTMKIFGWIWICILGGIALWAFYILVSKYLLGFG